VTRDVKGVGIGTKLGLDMRRIGVYASNRVRRTTDLKEREGSCACDDAGSQDLA